MRLIEDIASLRQVRQAMQGKVGLVPTMGALHEGHLSLVEYARAENDHVITTIFVNPTQFSPDEDLGAYPRDLDGDLAKLEQAGVDAVFFPSPTLMYPSGFQTYVMVEDVAQGLEGGQRPEHFRGVATIVAKLFNLVQPSVAYFGQKDAQQVVVIRRMVADLNFPLEIAVCPIVRELDGVAMSSRNVYLNAEERENAGILNQSLRLAGEAYAQGERDPNALRMLIQSNIGMIPTLEADYISVARADNLQEVHEATDVPVLVSLAVQVGKPRLLDNCLLPLSLNTREGASKVLGRSDNET